MKRRLRRLTALAVMLLLGGVYLARGPAPAPSALGSPLAQGSVMLVPVLSGLSEPLYVTHAGDGTNRLYIVEKAGTIRLVMNGQVQPALFLDFRSLVNSGGFEQGLLGLAFHPQYATNGYLYVSYTDANGDITIARYTAAADRTRADPATASVLLRIGKPFENHNGGMLAFGPDRYLYISTGDGGGAGDPDGNAQNGLSLLGKLLRIDVDSAQPYAIPPTNPFVGAAGMRPEIWALGLRNPWRYSFDRTTGDLYIADVGQNTYEEVDLQRAGSAAGQNYGWNRTEGFHCYNATSCTQSGLTLPIIEYDHSQGDCSVTGGYVYRGTLIPALYGAYVYGDYCTGRIWSLQQNAAGSWIPTPLLDTSLLISSFGEDQAGEVYVADIGGGVVYRLAVVGTAPTPTPIPAALTVTFDDRLGQDGVLDGEYPAGVIDWGTSRWWHSGPYGAFTTKSVTFNGAVLTSASYTLLVPRRLVSLQAYNGGTAGAIVTVSCTGQPTQQVVLGAGQLSTVQTGWTGTCTTVTIASTNGWDTNFDNLVFDSGPSASPTATPTRTATPTTGPSPTPAPGPDLIITAFIASSMTTDQPIPLSVTVTNRGTTDTGPGGGFDVHVYADLPGPPSPGETRLVAHLAFGPLGAQASVMGSGSIPAGTLGPGPHILWAYVDAHEIVAESNESNNTASAPIAVGAQTTATPSATGTPTGTPTATGTATPIRTPTATPALVPTPLPVCSPRPNIRVATSAGVPGSLNVTVTANGANNTLHYLQFVTDQRVLNPNALIDIAGQADRVAPFTINLPRETTQFTFVVRRVDPGTTTVPFIVGDDCGTWPTLAGGGPNAY